MARRDTDDDAPWLAEAELSPRRGQGRETTRVSRRSLFWTLFIGLVLVAVAGVGVMVLVARKDGGSTQGYMNAENAPLISAETGPYKVLPSDPKGLEVAGQDQTLYATGEGADQGSVIDESAVPETPMARPGSGATSALATPVAPPASPPGAPRDLLPEARKTMPSAPEAAPPVVPRDAAVAARPMVKPAKIDAAKAETPKPDALKPDAAKLGKPDAAKLGKPEATKVTKAAKADVLPPAVPETKPVKPDGTAHTVQLGAFSSPEKAEAAWNALANRGMMGFNHRLIKIEKGDTTLYRLRASGGDAAALCAKLKSAGDACSVVE